jgi:hypothetical protein
LDPSEDFESLDRQDPNLRDDGLRRGVFNVKLDDEEEEAWNV